MNGQGRGWGPLVSLGVALGFGFGLYHFLVGLIAELKSMDSDLGKALVAGVASVMVVVAGKIWERRSLRQQEAYERKIPVYEKQIAELFKVLMSQKRGESLDEDDLLVAFTEFTEKLIIWGGPRVVRAWRDFRVHDWSSGKPRDGLAVLARLMLEVRADLGNSNRGLGQADVLKLFINDYDSAFGDAAEGSAHDGELVAEPEDQVPSPPA